MTGIRAANVRERSSSDARFLAVRVAVVAWLLCPAWSAQREAPSDGGAPAVLLRATVVDKSGNPVTNLPREAFKVFEEGVEQKVQVFRLEDGPMSIGVLVDVSASMKSIAANLRQSVERFVATAGPQGEFFLVEFSNAAYLEVPRTMDAGKLTTWASTPKQGSRTCCSAKTSKSTASASALNLGPGCLPGNSLPPVACWRS